MRVERERFVIVKKSRHGGMILCTVANKPEWRYIIRLNDTGDLIRSYMSEAKAKQAFKKMGGRWNPNRFRILRVIETYQTVHPNAKVLQQLRKRVQCETNLSDEIPRFLEEGEGFNDPNGLEGAESLSTMDPLLKLELLDVNGEKPEIFKADDMGQEGEYFEDDLEDSPE